ncbi:ABC transporter permease [Paraburkholderia unamae]|jgi:peptide/nickel transport system permease protein|uniref:Peptide/nickel transport system permease protein n=1 Tax=Paraburkholderia unamae TaxID=219649 RepID=A0ABX5K9X6_9BURK|nr:ABC transporter permease [Paraburkholderia unamae]PVX61348.1 peptide/nickel transport system permease protein [Paraburkholderia unamae]RAR56700.1 peptide/nickel transport system permease protein [Paraburkholderia unamae]CAG9269965.1 glutathione ABC transporter membrane subunit GsiD [Paraburkholderia unamae]
MNAFKRTNLIVGAVLIVPLVLTAVAGAVHTPYDPTAVDLLARYSAPGSAHWFGTDEFGRDVLSRIMAGATQSLTISALSVLLALLCGTTLGVISGYAGSWTDRLLMMIVEALMAFPGLLLALGIMTVLGPSRGGVILALGLAYTPAVMRIARGSTLALRQREFVVASRAMGNGGAWTVLRHIAPNCVPPLLVFSTTLFGSAILAESALSFLGLGVQPPAPTWGGMLADSRTAMDHAIWLAIFPGLAISLALLGINLFGDGLRDVLDPRMKGVKA